MIRPGPKYMRTHHICQKCGGHRIIVVKDVALGATLDAESGEPRDRFEAYVCEQCRYTELYASSAIPVDGDRVTLIGASEDEVFDEWADQEPESMDFYDNPWASEDITEVSRVEKKPDSQHAAKVTLVDLGERPADILTVLRENLGLRIPNVEWLGKALPFVVLELISMDAARGLQKLLEDAGGVAEISNRQDL